MNPLAITQLLILLWSTSIFGAQAGLTSKTRILCVSESLPSEIQSLLKEEYGSWRIQKPEDLSQRARGRWEAEKPLACPGIAVGHFEDAKTPSYAILLVPVRRTDEGYRFLVFSRKSDDAPYEPRLVDKLDDKGAVNYFIHTVAIRKFFDEVSRKKFQARMPEGVLLIDAADKEYEVDVYFWSGGHYRHEPLDY